LGRIVVGQREYLFVLAQRRLRAFAVNVPRTGLSTMHATLFRPTSLFTAMLGLFLLGAPSAAAQEPPDTTGATLRHTPGGGGGFFALGVNATTLGPLNDRLRRAGYPTFPSELVAIGGGGYGVVANRLLIGGEGYGLVAPSRGYQGRDVSVGGGYGLFTLGYRLRPADEVRAYPLVGVGGGGLSLDIGGTGADRFGDVLDDPNRAATLEKGGVLVSLGGGLEYRFSGADDPGGFQVGLRAGYLFSPYDTDWTLSEDRLSGGPDATLGGLFVRLLVGGWGGDE
jgi:hypothetical protein